jgi:adenine C2-methylase RlmN of 23S rRNA A2503 and tRNA A37
MIRISDFVRPKLIDVVSAKKHFVANRWAYEIAEKYLFEVDGEVLEVGVYDHYEDEKMSRYVKSVLELPTSYGCPMKCKYCASSWINKENKLTIDTLQALADQMFEILNIQFDRQLLIALTGTGDAFFTLDLIFEFIKSIKEKYRYFSFTISSCNWTSEMLAKVEGMAETISFRNVQSTFISYDKGITTAIIPMLDHIEHDFSDFIEHVKKSKHDFWRINYLLLRLVNDDNNSFEKFIHMIKPIRDKILVRVSSLNETIASKSNALQPSPLDRATTLLNALLDTGINAYLFHSYANDNMNCGQLVLENALRYVKKTDNIAI